MTGQVWENFVFIELDKWLQLSHPEWTLWFYRDQQQREADFLIQGPWHRIRVLDAKWSETPRTDSFATLGDVASLLVRAEGVTETEVALVSRGTTSHRLGDRRHLVSAFRLDSYLS
jgi:hypothetical protein